MYCTLRITAMELVSSRNIEEMVLVLKKEVAKTHNIVEHEDTGKYRQLLVRTLHSCCIKVSFCQSVFEKRLQSVNEFMYVIVVKDLPIKFTLFSSQMWQQL